MVSATGAEHGQSFSHRIHRMPPTSRAKTTVHPRLKAFTDATVPFRPLNKAPYRSSSSCHHILPGGRVWKSHTWGPATPSKPGMCVARKLETPHLNHSTDGAVIAPPLSNVAAAYGPLNEARSANTEGGKVLWKGGWAVGE